jgi:hypothetical protein
MMYDRCDGWVLELFDIIDTQDLVLFVLHTSKFLTCGPAATDG